MKKLLCMLLVLVMLLSACTPPASENSNADTSGDVSGEVVERPVYTLSEQAVNELYTQRSEALKGEALRVGERINEALGAKYTISEGNDNKFKDNGTLTDGDYCPTHYKFVKTGWTGIIKSGSEIVVDLGKTKDNLCEFEVSTCRNTEYEVDICDAMFVYISTDGNEWKNVGIYQSTGLEADKARHTFTANLDGVVSARYVKFTFEGLKDGFMVMDEVSVFSYGEKTVEKGNVNSLNDYYGANKVPVITEDKYFDSSVADYNTRKNLLAGLLPVTYECSTDVATTMLSAGYNTLPSTGALTDGKRATSSTYSDSKWHRNTHGTTRTAVYDFGGIVAIDSVSTAFLVEASTGVRLPENFSVSVSLDGKTWYAVYEEAKSNDSEKAIVPYGGDFDKAYKARYVKFTFSCNVHTYLDEIEIFGTLNAENGAEPSTTPIKTPSVTSDYGKPEDYDGMHDVVLSYLLPGEVNVTKAQYLTYVAYLEDGEIKDTFFDGFMYLPYVKYLYSGDKKKLTKEEWQLWIDTEFMEGLNFDALDAAVDETKEALDLDDDYTVGTYLSLFYPVYGATNFGELNGKQMDFHNIEDRKAVLKWFVDEQVKGFKEKGYDSVRLSGFYWFVEEMSGSDPHIKELVNYICDYVRSLGYQTTWIPYFSASGNTAWRDYGFDTACLQPNYAFDEEVPLQRIYDAATMAKLYGMSIEIEIQDTSSAKWVDRYRQYLYVGAEVGFMTDSVHMYYLAGMPGAIYNAYMSKEENINCMYKETYLFIKGKLISEFAAPEASDIKTENGITTGKLTSDPNTAVCDGMRIVTGPKHGSVSIGEDGSFSYLPYPGYKGEDSFTVVADYGLAGRSELVEVTVIAE